MGKVRLYNKQSPDTGRKCIVRLDEETTVIATLNINIHGTAFWKFDGTNITIIPSDEDQWIYEEEIWNI